MDQKATVNQVINSIKYVQEAGEAIRSISWYINELNRVTCSGTNVRAPTVVAPRESIVYNKGIEKIKVIIMKTFLLVLTVLVIVAILVGVVVDKIRNPRKYKDGCDH